MSECISTVTDRNIVFADKKSKCVFRIKNEQQRAIEKHKVDGCLIKGEESNKCDWLAIDVASSKEIYIELKGKDIEHAVKQLCASVDQLSSKKSIKKLAYVIATRCPLNSAEINKLSAKIWRSHKLDLVVKTMDHTESIENLIC